MTVVKYDASQIKVETRIINGKEFKVKVIPTGMHGEGWREGLFDEIDAKIAETDEIFKEEISVDDIPEMEDEDDLVSRHEKLTEIE